MPLLLHMIFPSTLSPSIYSIPCFLPFFFSSKHNFMSYRYLYLLPFMSTITFFLYIICPVYYLVYCPVYCLVYYLLYPLVWSPVLLRNLSLFLLSPFSYLVVSYLLYLLYDLLLPISYLVLSYPLLYPVLCILLILLLILVTYDHMHPLLCFAHLFCVSPSCFFFILFCIIICVLFIQFLSYSNLSSPISYFVCHSLSSLAVISPYIVM